MLDNKGFDLWSDDYDKSVNLCAENNDYPFAGYKDVLNDVYKQVRERKNAEILDIGFGTGVLTTQLYNAGCKVTGIDFSANMISIAQQKMPNAILINCDFSKSLPDEISKHRFDYIISTYAMHHLIDSEKVNMIKLLSSLLYPKGNIVIGDISFRTRKELEACKAKYHDLWDDDEVYFVAEEMIGSLGSCYCSTYIEKSFCAGILNVSNK